MIRRRLYAEIRTSRLAVWSLRLAIFALPVLLLDVLLHRAGAIEYRAAIVLLAAALSLTLLAFVLSVAALIVIWNEGLKGLSAALLAFTLSAVVLAYPGYEILRGIRLPAISDVSTDTSDPPQFNAVIALRTLGSNSHVFTGDAELQRRYYPAVRTVEFDAEVRDIYAEALALAQRSGWRIVRSNAPDSNRDGIIEAVGATMVMGFREDIVIRVRRAGPVAKVDIRSASRFGRRDFGSNARRIESFLAQLAELRSRPR